MASQEELLLRGIRDFLAGSLLLDIRAALDKLLLFAPEELKSVWLSINPNLQDEDINRLLDSMETLSKAFRQKSL